MARKDDRRIMRTRKLLRESILALILEKGYDEISIQDVTDKANLGRATFYLHYREKDDLLVDLIRQFVDEFVSSAPQLSFERSNIRDQRSVQRLFEYVENHYDIYRILMIGKGYVVASRELHELLRNGVAKGLVELLREDQKKLSVPRDFVENYLAGALLALLYWWLDNDMPYTPADMAQMYQHLNWLDEANFDRLLGEPILPPNARKRKRQLSESDYQALPDEEESDETAEGSEQAEEAKPAPQAKAKAPGPKKE